jgi:hypothetical protein
MSAKMDDAVLRLETALLDMLGAMGEGGTPPESIRVIAQGFSGLLMVGEIGSQAMASMLANQPELASFADEIRANAKEKAALVIGAT